MNKHKSLTELLIRKEREVAERRGTNLMHSAIERERVANLEREDAGILRLDGPAETGPGGEVVDPRVVGLPLDAAAGLEAMRRRGHRIAEDASIRRTNLLLQPSFNVLPMALDVAEAVQASNSVEKMIVHQMALCHEMALRLGNRALSYEHSRAGDQVEACRLVNATARLMAAFQDAAPTLQRLRTGGSQTVTVQHVNVAPGGQAVVGNVQTGGTKRRGTNGK